MKSITIMIEDEFYVKLERYSLERGEEKSTTIEDWKQERGFGKYGRRKNVSHTLCR